MFKLVEPPFVRNDSKQLYGIEKNGGSGNEILEEQLQKEEQATNALKQFEYTVPKIAVNREEFHSNELQWRLLKRSI